MAEEVSISDEIGEIYEGTASVPSSVQSSSTSSVTQQSQNSPMGDLVNAMTDAFRQSVSKQEHDSVDSLRRSMVRPPRPYSIGQNFKTWLAQFSEYGALVNIPADKRRAFLMNSLDQQAYRAVQLLRLPDSSSYKDFIDALKTRFDTGKTTSDYKLLLRNRCQKPNEDAETYADNLIDLAENAYPSADYSFKDEMAKDCFLDGVRCGEGIREQLFVKQPKTLPEAVRLVRQLESARMASRSGSFKPSQSKGYLNQVNEKESDVNVDELKQLMLKINMRLETLENQVSQNNSAQRSERGRDLSKLKCFSCRRYGHYARDCPEKAQGNDSQGLSRGSQSL